MSNLVKRTSKNQVTLPAKLLKGFEDVVYFDVSVREGSLMMAPVRPYAPSQALQEARKKFKALGLDDTDIAAAVLETRAKPARKAKA
jgi:hypothetical protein